MHYSIKNFYKPHTTDEAIGIFEKNPEKSVFMSGGTNLAKNNLSRYDTIIDIKSNFKPSIENSKDFFEISACTSLQEMLENVDLNDYFDSFFKKHFQKIGSWQIRNMATLGGSIASRVGWSDVISLLLLLRTEVKIVNKNEKKWIRLEDLNKGMKKGHIIEKIRIMKSSLKYGYKRFSRTEFDIGLLNCGMTLKLDDNKIKDIKVVFGSVPVAGKRYAGIENALRGKEIYEAIEISPELVNKMFDGKASPFISREYRFELAKVFLSELLVELAGVKL